MNQHNLGGSAIVADVDNKPDLYAIFRSHQVCKFNFKSVAAYLNAIDLRQDIARCCTAQIDCSHVEWSYADLRNSF